MTQFSKQQRMPARVPMVLLLVLCLAGLIVPGASAQGATPAAATPAPADSVLVFQNVIGGAIYAINANGTNLHYVTNGMDPALSPDRQWIAFTRWNLNLSGLFLIKIDGTGERQILDHRLAKNAFWSPDGTRIAISVQDGLQEVVNGKWRIAVVTVADAHFQEMPCHDLSYSPTWSPDGQKIAYASDRGLSLTWEGAGAAITRDPNTFRLSDLAYQDRSPAWSPDGSNIAFQYRKDDHSEIYLMNADGSGRVALTKTPVRKVAVSPAWSPDGSQIAYLSNVSGKWDVWVMNRDGSNQHAMFAAGTLASVAFEYKNVDERMISWR